MFKVCPHCEKSALPFVMVLVVSIVSAFVTWLTLSFAQFSDLESLIGGGLMFTVVGTTLLHYVVNCMKRHCRHGSTGHQHHAVG